MIVAVFFRYFSSLHFLLLGPLPDALLYPPWLAGMFFPHFTHVTGFSFFFFHSSSPFSSSTPLQYFDVCPDHWHLKHCATLDGFLWDSTLILSIWVILIVSIPCWKMSFAISSSNMFGGSPLITVLTPFLLGTLKVWLCLLFVQFVYQEV